MARTTNGRVAYADLLRSFSVIAAIMLYLAGSRMEAVSVSGSAFAVFNIYNGLVRWCVPVFVMLSGAFLLDPKRSGRLSVLLLRCLRVFVALVLWGTVYAIVDRLLADGGLSRAGIKSALLSVVRGQTHSHLWFLYVVLGLYLITPILRAFVKGASRRDFHYFFILTFLVAMLLPTLLRFRYSQILDTYLERLDITLVLGYVGYYVAGYYLKAFTLNRVAEFILYALGAGGCFITVWGTQVLSRQAGRFTNVLYDYMSPNVCLTAVALFVLFRYVLGVSEERNRRQRLGGVAKISLGIYLVHDLFVLLLQELGITTLSFAPALSVPVLTAAVFLLSFAVAWLLSKIPLLGRYIT